MLFTAIDTSQNSRQLVHAIKAGGITAIGRYYTKRRNNSKILIAEEARLLSEAGIKIWPVYQNRHREAVDFGTVKGRQDAEDALDYAQNVIGQPRGTAIYFSVDFDATQVMFNSAIRPHFEAINAIFAAAGNPYRVGVYGSGAICKSLLDASLAEVTWLSHSRLFRGTQAFKASRRWNILQALPVRDFAGFEDEIDPNEINGDFADFGGFLLAVPGPVQPIATPAVIGVAREAAAGARIPANPDLTTTPVFPGRSIARGEINSDDVKVMQAQLNALGFGPLVVDGDFGEGTHNAVLHFQARNSALDGRPLEIDGEVDALTWAALFGAGAVFSTDAFNTAASMRDLVIDIATSQVGVKEEPRGSNRGAQVDVYIRTTGLDPAADSFPWCVCFLYWVFEQAAKIKGKENPMPKTAGVITLWNLGRRAEADVVRKSEASGQTIKAGMIFLLDLGGGKGHAGLVIDVKGETVVTIEGNTNAGGSRDGFGVFRRDAMSIKPSVLLGYLDFCSDV